MKNFLWVDRYRPHSIKNCILPESLKSIFQSYVDAQNIPNITLVGPPGVGKTSVALAMMDEIDADYLKINAALKKGMDVIRNDIMEFASSVSFNAGRKYVIFDEGDNMRKDAQESLKSFIEEYSKNCGFIFTCNSIDKLDEALQSRCPPIRFDFTPDTMNELLPKFGTNLCDMLTLESVEFDKKVLAILIKKMYPDFRKIIGVLQTYALKNKKIDSGILSTSQGSDLESLIRLLQNKNWNDMRKWVGENFDSISEFTIFAKNLFNQIKLKVQASCLPTYVMLQNQFDYQSYFVIDKEVNTVAFLTQIMAEMIWL